MKAVLVGVCGRESDEFYDLLGQEGELHLNPNGESWFEDLVLCVKKAVKKENKIFVSTKLGNNFTFELK